MTCRLVCLWIVLVLFSVAGLVSAQSVAFTKIVDTSTPVPGGTGTFGGPLAFSGIALEAGKVAFLGDDAAHRAGIFLYEGALRRIDGTNGDFQELFGPPSLDGGRVAFSAFSQNLDQRAVFSDLSGNLRTLVGANVLIPGGLGTFNDYGQHVALSGGHVAFVGGVADLTGSFSQEGVYTTLGGLRKIADRNTAVPGRPGSFSGFREVGFDGTDIAFSVPVAGSSVDQGIYRTREGALSLVADTSTPIPSGEGNFLDFRAFSFDAGTAAFVGTGSNNQMGVYTAGPGGAIRKVADRSTSMPGTSVPFGGFSNMVAFSGENVAFAGFRLSERTLNAEIGGHLVTLLRSGSTLGGKVVSDFRIGPESMDGSQIAFGVSFTDSSQAIYLATVGCVPGPTQLCLNNGRFAVTATWETRGGESGAAHAVRLTNDTGYLWFFSETNVEAVVKVLNGCGLNNHYWVFAGGLTDVEVELTVLDTLTGETSTYTNPQGAPFQPIQDTSAFPTCP